MSVPHINVVTVTDPVDQADADVLLMSDSPMGDDVVITGTATATMPIVPAPAPTVALTSASASADSVAPSAPTIAVVTRTDTEQPSGLSAILELRDRVVSSDTWSRDEPQFRDMSHPTVYIPLVNDQIRTQAEILANLSGEAVKYIQEQHTLCFGGPELDSVTRAYQVSEAPREVIDQADATTIDGIFKEKTMWMMKAMNDIQNDPAITQEQRVQVFTAARCVTTMFIQANGVILSVSSMARCAQASAAGQMGSDAEATWRYMPVGSDETENAVQRLYKIAFNEARQLGYARYKDNFMRRVVTTDGFITNAWEAGPTIKDFVFDLTSKPNGEIQFLAKRGVNIMDNVADLLLKAREPTVPWLKLDRHVFAFKNGCYLAKDELFVRFNKSGPPVMPSGKPCPTACKYHNCTLDERWLDEPDWTKIPTPTVDFIMDTQRLSKDVKRTYCAMLGRALYNLGEMDNWQVLLYVKGQAETGKSTLLKFVASFYNSADVGILASNIEVQFGASMLANKFIVIGDDLQEEFQLNQQLFNNFATGNDVSLPVKNAKFAMVIKWITQLLLSGNVLPGYKDNSGAFSRRLIIVYYGVPVIHVDPTLPDKLEAETAAAIVKFNRAYRNMIRRLDYLRTRSAAEGPQLTFWEAIPEDFRVQKRNVMQSSNSFMSFFHSGQLVFGPTLYMPRVMFTNALMQYCQSNSIPRPKFQPSSYEGPFGIMNLRMSARQTFVYPRNEGGKSLTEQWVIGCDVPTGDVLASATADHIKAAEKAQQDYMAGNSEESRLATAAGAGAGTSLGPHRKRRAAEITTVAATAAGMPSASAVVGAGTGARAPPAEKRARF